MKDGGQSPPYSRVGSADRIDMNERRVGSAHRRSMSEQRTIGFIHGYYLIECLWFASAV